MILLHFIDVILPLALPQQYTYSVPAPLVQGLQVGMRVVVPLGKSKLYSALVYKIHQQAPQGYETKDVIQVIDDEPIVLPLQIKLWEWIASYYLCSLGEVMKAALPSALKLESETYIDRVDCEGFDLTESEQQVMFMLDGAKKFTIQDIVSKSGVRNPMSVVKSLIGKNVIVASERLGEEYKPKVEAYLTLAPPYRNQDVLNELLGGLKRAPAQERVLLGLLSFAENPASMVEVKVAKRLLLQRVDASPTVVATLIQKGILVQEMVEVSRIETADTDLGRQPATLNEHQQVALEQIRENFGRRKVVLLHGVTSSGKTEIYIHLVQEAISEGKQVLYLLPEIALTAQIVNRLRNVFGNRVGVYHSKYGDAQRAEVYNGVLSDDDGSNLARYDIILGVRSSVFLPFRNLGLVIVDEEHENTYKQYNPSPRYNARDVAVVLASLHGAHVLMGTATPSVESYYNAQAGKYALVQLSERHRGMELPQVRVVDLKKARRDRKMRSHFSQEIITHIEATLARNEQVILFQNRRGFAPFVECNECGWVPRCEHCDVTLTFHKYSNQLVCHYCGYSYQQPQQCLACGSPSLMLKGFGTEKVEDDLAIFFPNARVARLDLDSTRSRAAYEQFIDKFERGEVDILIGTQMVSKGLDFDRVSLVGILNADNMLNFPDFRAFERSYQLMSQVSGRAGRKGKRGLVILQTAQPDHHIVQQVVAQDYPAMYAGQIAERGNFMYPPFCRLVNISLKHRDKDVLQGIAEAMANGLRQSLGDGVLGPEAPLVARVQNLYILDILVKINREQPLVQVKDLIARYAVALKQGKNLHSLQIAIDVDPM